MAYNVKDVFYLSTGMTLATGDAGATTAQLDLSAYIDPIARGRQKGTGLAIYKVHWDVSGAGDGDELVPVAESGAFKIGLIAGAGFGDNATGTFVPTGMSQSMSCGNSLAIYGADWYGPDAMVTAAASNVFGPTGPMNRTFLEPSKDVPYVVVRDNVCLVTENLVAMQTLSYVNVRLECAQISLDQATLNQLLRTQTV
jgi:hypothetical protein